MAQSNTRTVDEFSAGHLASEVSVLVPSASGEPSGLTSLDGSGGQPGLARPGGHPSEVSLQPRTYLPACLQSDQPGVGDPLGMGPEPVNPDAKSTSEARGPNKYSEAPGLSQVLGTVLQQLSVSAWVPAAMLVGNVALLLQLSTEGSYNVAQAVKGLAGKPLGTVIILVFSLILATTVTQAFEFEVIRFLEGYFDSANRLIQVVMAARIRRHEGKQRRLEDKLREATKVARKAAVERMRGFPAYDSKILDYLADDTASNDEGPDYEVSEKANETDWKPHASASALYRIDSTIARLKSYPEKSRLLPTRLGNVLRATEDNIDLEEGENVEGYVVRNYDQLSAALKSQHKDYRTRLDMYCCLVLVFSILAVASFATLVRVNPLWGTGVAVLVYVSMACLSYEAAIATARTYGLILQEIPQYLARQRESAETDQPSALEKLLALLHRNTV